MAGVSSINLRLLSHYLELTVVVTSGGDSIIFVNGVLSSRRTSGGGAAAPDAGVLSGADKIALTTKRGWVVEMKAAAFLDVAPLFPGATKEAVQWAGGAPGCSIELLPIHDGVFPSGPISHDTHVGVHSQLRSLQIDGKNVPIRMARCANCGLFWFGR